MTSKIGFYAGSFDPFTKGHFAVLKESLKEFDKIVIGVGLNPDKKELFTQDERVEQIKHLLKDIPNVEVLSYKGLTVDEAIKCNADALIRGERIIGEHDSELELAFMNQLLFDVRGSKIKTHFITISDESLRYVSSSACKYLCSIGEFEAAKYFVAPYVYDELIKRYIK
ncbi:MAG: pantetheine-phosphate adenylyltransferase [Lactobacillus sp.]|jgi:pantetheine-phosphate adenylyltransferase|nr:pantetheine-phosphate adenylyltransferase [Lactobacillus sp.]